jgi:hypothetical protein
MMNDKLDYQALTSEEVLEVYRSVFGRSPYLYPSLVNGELAGTTTVEDWDCSWNLFDATFGSGERSFANYWNEWWGVDIPWNEWSPILLDSTNHTVADVCELIAKYARRPVARVVTILGRRCADASMFLAIRTLLVKAGADEDSIGPSTELAEYTKNYLTTFDRQIRLLAPSQRLSATIVRNTSLVQLERVIKYSMFYLVGAAAVALLLPAFAEVCMLCSFFAGLIAVVVGTIAVIVGELTPACVTFGELQTFRDLAQCLVGKKSAVVVPNRTSRDR